MNKRFPYARPARSTTRAPAQRPFRTSARALARTPLVAALLALGACSEDEPAAVPDRTAAAPTAPSATGDPSTDIFGAPFNDGFLTIDEALALAATGQTIEVPSVGAATPPATGGSDGDGDAGTTGSIAGSTTGDTTAGTDGGAGGTTGDATGGTAGTSTGGTSTGGDTNGDAAAGTAGGTEGGTAGTATGATSGGDTGGGTGAPPTSPATDEVGDDTIGDRFVASVSDGFTGEVLEDGSVKVEWAIDRSARGYNTYRDAEYVTTVFDTEWVDEDAHDGDFYYEIEAFDVADNFTRIATGLTVPVRGSGRPDPTPDERATPQIDDYELVFSEEFEGDALDLNTWNTSYLWGDELVINQEEQHYVDIENDPDFGFDPFEVGDGTLKIKSIETPPELLDKANRQPYLSGVITSYDAFQFTYGYAEARARTPYGKGLWSAFWLLNAFYGDDDPEIDIMEHIGDDQDVVYHTYHYYDGPETLRSTESFPVPGIDFIGGFHTYAVDWRPGLLIFYVDGRETHRVSDPRVSNQDMYIIANTALGGWWPGSPDDTTEFPASYEIDYIRVYRKSTPYADAPFSDDAQSDVPMADEVPGTSPNHRPPLDQFPNGYPTR